jgi:hypothetical protein
MFDDFMKLKIQNYQAVLEYAWMQLAKWRGVRDCRSEWSDQHQKPRGHTVWCNVNHWLGRNYAQSWGTDTYSEQNSDLHKDSSIEKQIFCRIMRGNGALYQTLLFYCNSRWLTRKICGSCLQLSRSSTALEEENLVHAEHFLVYLSGIF